MADIDWLNESRRSSTERPQFLIVCDHGVRGDHADCDHTTGCAEVDRVGLLPWFPRRPGWWAADDTDGAAIVVYSLAGNERGSDPWDILGESEPAGGDPNREAIEIRCLAEGCRTRALRVDDAALQTVLESVLSLVVEQPGFRDIYTPSVSDSRVVVTLQGLWVARRHAAQL